MLKSAALIRYSEPMISSSIWVAQEVKNLEEKITLLQNEKLALERAKQELSSKVAELKGQVQSKYEELQESSTNLLKLRKAQVELIEEIFKLKVEIKYIEEFIYMHSFSCWLFTYILFKTMIPYLCLVQDINALFMCSLLYF